MGMLYSIEIYTTVLAFRISDLFIITQASLGTFVASVLTPTLVLSIGNPDESPKE